MSQRRVSRYGLRFGIAVFLTLTIGLLAYAYAQSGYSAFNLNSPASFPVDI